MDKETTKGQHQNDNDNLLCPDVSSIDKLSYCGQCNKKLQINYNNNSTNEYLQCPECSLSRPNSPVNSTSSRQTVRSQHSQSRNIQLRLKRLEEERALNLEQVELQRKYLNKKYQLLEEEADVSSTRSESVQNWVNNAAFVATASENCIDNTLTTINNIVNKTTSNQIVQEAAAHVEQTSNENYYSCVNSEQIPQNSRMFNNIVPPVVCSTLTTVAPICAPVVTTIGDYQIGTEPINIQATSQQPVNVTFSNISTSDIFHNTLPSFLNTNVPFPNNPTINPTFNYNAPISSTMYSHNPTLPTQFISYNQLPQGSINARQSVPKILPTFCGNSEDWPLFISTFEWSTSICRFTHAENLIRLQNSLKDDALQSVQHMLLHPSNVPCVIDTLRMLYGQPEKILKSITNRIISSPKVDENNIHTLTALAIKVRSLICTINASNLTDEINNTSLLEQLLKKLPITYQMQWATHKMQLIKINNKPNLLAFDQWLYNIGLTASTLSTESTINKQYNKNNNRLTNSSINKTTTNQKAYIHTHQNMRKCFLCNKSSCKALNDCPTYRSLDRNEKWKVIRTNKLCKYCLCLHSGECNKKKRCNKEECEYYHHPSLHNYFSSKDKKPSYKQEEELINSHSAQENNILFKIMPIKVYGNNKIIKTYAFIDEGSSISLMDESLFNDLEVSGVPTPLCLRWTGGMQRNEQNSKKLKIDISGENKQRMSVNVCTVKSLNLPTQTLDYKLLCQNYSHLRNISVESYADAQPRLLIGLNNFNLGISSKVREGKQNEPVAILTKLGWLIYGRNATSNVTSKHFNFHTCDCSANIEQLNELVKSFYSYESIGISLKDPLISENEKRAINLLDKYTKLKKNGHYEVPLLWKFDNFKLPDSFKMALNRLICLEKIVLRNVELKKIFDEVISNYLTKGYIRKLNDNEIYRDDGKIWYLPIFAVFNKNKPGKSRVVWDAAAKANGSSLNSFLLKGPDFYISLPSILFKFRQKHVAVCGDIEEMFHQIQIRSEDRDVQRFLWRDCDQSRSPNVYIMDVMIFGATCAPSISQYIKNINADKYAMKFPLAAKSIKQNHYVDDLLDSVNTPEEAIKLISDISYIHRQAGFNIRHWISNNKSVRKAFDDTTSDGFKCISFKDETQIEKVLGIFWNYNEDVITFKIANWLIESDLFSHKKSPTKREVLRLVMSIYDPLGLIAHIIMYVKVLMQDVWRSKIDWDTPIPPDLMIKWKQWLQILPNIQNVKLQRCYLQSFANYSGVDVQLHTFVDASNDGYAAVSYFRLIKNNSIRCTLVSAKTKVAPLKLTSIPRLELMAALIGARLAKFIEQNHEIKISKKYFWCDSKTVLSWINSDHRKYHQFVAFRITEILELSGISDWRWVSSKQNVADEATKWSNISKCFSSNRWFHGPDFIHQHENQWPPDKPYLSCTKEEQKHFILQITKYQAVFNIFRFSKWTRLLRATAYSFRFINNCRNNIKQKGEITQQELIDAERALYIQIQSEEYSTEIAQLKSGMPLKKSSDIFFKSPYIDNNILRVDSRIDNAEISLQQKRPIILPRKNYLTKLVCLYYHEKLYHSNHETVINELRQRYCISKIRATYKSIIRHCQMCKINKAVPRTPQMAKLPRARVASYAAPFSFTGVDFFGPILVTVNRHIEKRYGCLFTCLTVRAVHIEITHSLTTSSCILAIRNFMSRRGVPLEFYSDNGTNFVGAERELREALEEVDRNKLIKNFTTTTTKWKFNPPAAPHMGGAWERLVRSIKVIFYKIMPTRHPTDELLLSMMIEVENIINSRPLAYVPIETENSEAITPNHFLIGSSNGLKPLTIFNDSGIVLKQNWLISQQFANIFWKKWLAEYLPSITCRSKWYEKSKPLSQGDLVIIVDPSSPRHVWLRGKILETREAADGQVRSARVLTQRGIIERPAIKLAVLEVAPQEKSGGEETSCHTAGGM